MKRRDIINHAVGLALSLAFCWMVPGCGGSSAPKHAAGSSLSRDVAKQAASAAALVAHGRICEVEATGSMLPTFDDRAFVVVEQCTVADIRTGDIVVRKLAGRNIVHRAISSGPNARTRGDAASSDDSGAVTDADLVGRAVGIVWAKEGRP